MSENERMAVLETEMSVVKGELKDIKIMLMTVVESVNKSKGFWAGAVAAGTALGAALGFMLNYIFSFKVG